MPVKMTPVGPKLSLAEINSLESRLKVNLPQNYREFLLTYNAAEPVSNQFRRGEISTSVMTFFGLSDNRSLDLEAAQLVYAGRLPEHVLAIAATDGGNLICLDLKNGSVFLWDHEREAGDGEEPGFENMDLLALSFTEFLEELQPFNPDDVVLNPADVKSVEFAPGFLDLLKKMR
jgi:hypothetical protein